MKRKKKLKLRKDAKGEYILQKYFVHGKQRFQKIYIIDGMPADTFYEQNADSITLFQNADYELLNKRDN